MFIIKIKNVWTRLQNNFVITHSRLSRKTACVAATRLISLVCARPIVRFYEPFRILHYYNNINTKYNNNIVIGGECCGMYIKNALSLYSVHPAHRPVWFTIQNNMGEMFKGKSYRRPHFTSFDFFSISIHLYLYLSKPVSGYTFHANFLLFPRPRPEHAHRNTDVLFNVYKNSNIL